MTNATARTSKALNILKTHTTLKFPHRNTGQYNTVHYGVTARQGDGWVCVGGKVLCHGGQWVTRCSVGGVIMKGKEEEEKMTFGEYYWLFFWT